MTLASWIRRVTKLAQSTGSIVSTQSILQKQKEPLLTRMLKWQVLTKPLLGNYISVGLLYTSAWISLSVTSVNNSNKEHTCHLCVSLQDIPTCHWAVAWPLASTPHTPAPHLVVGYLPEHRSDSSQPQGAVRVVDGAGGDQQRLPLTQPAPPTIAASDSFA